VAKRYSLVSKSCCSPDSLDPLMDTTLRTLDIERREEMNTMTRRSILQCGAAVAAPALMPAFILGAAEKDPVAKTSSGMVRGRVENGIFVYRGVPYGRDTAWAGYRADEVRPAQTRGSMGWRKGVRSARSISIGIDLRCGDCCRNGSSHSDGEQGQDKSCGIGGCSVGLPARARSWPLQPRWSQTSRRPWFDMLLIFGRPSQPSRQFSIGFGSM
jgi:hypothetical protein